MISYSDLKKKTNEIFRQLNHTGRPIIVTVNGRPDVVLLDVEVFEKKLNALNLSTPRKISLQGVRLSPNCRS
jgi:prevent-host-death family protein